MFIPRLFRLAVEVKQASSLNKSVLMRRSLDSLCLAPYVLIVGGSCTVSVVCSPSVLVIAEINPNYGT